MTNGERLSEVERLNEENARLMQEQAEQIRRATIKFAYEAIEIHLESDRASFENLVEKDFAEGTPDSRFVLEEMPHAAPLKEGQMPQRTFYILLAPRVPADESEWLRVHIPVPDDIVLEDFKMPLPEQVECIYLEYLKQGEPRPRRYVLAPGYMHEYISAGEADDGEEQLIGKSDDIMFRVLHKMRTDEALQSAMKAYTDILEMEVIPQKMGNEDVLDMLK